MLRARAAIRRGSNKGACESKESPSKKKRREGDINKVTLFRGEGPLAGGGQMSRFLFRYLRSNEMYLYDAESHIYHTFVKTLFLIGQRERSA